MVPPLTLVVDVHPLLALSRGFGHRAVGLDDRFFEERRRLLSPDLHPHVVDRAHQILDVAFIEAPTEVAGRRGVGDALRPERVQVHFVVAPQLDVFQAGSAGQEVVGDVEHVVRLMVRQMALQKMQPAIDGLDQPRSPGQQVHRSDPAASQTPHAVGQLVLNVTGGEHGPGLIRPVAITEPVLNSTLAVAQLLPSTLAHSKCLLAQGIVWSKTP